MMNAMLKKTDFFAQRLRQVRTKAGLTQQELADRSGLAWSTIQQFEVGRREPSFAALVKLAAGLGVSLSAFDQPAPEPEKPARRRRKGKE
jgi:transcriptional regulator with XRE-family HTH domain